MLRFLTRMGIVKYNNHSGYIASVINEYDLSAVKTYDAGFYKRLKEPGDPVVHNEGDSCICQQQGSRQYMCG